MADVDADQLSMLLHTVSQLAPLMRQHADEAERHRRLSPPVVQALAEAGIFRMCTPCATSMRPRSTWARHRNSLNPLGACCWGYNPCSR